MLSKNNIREQLININPVFARRYFFPKFLEILKFLDKNKGLRPIPLALIRQRAGCLYKLRKSETRFILSLMQSDGLIVMNSYGVYLKGTGWKTKTVFTQLGLNKWGSPIESNWNSLKGDARTKAYLKSYGIGKDE
jgi:hypothetical protein